MSINSDNEDSFQYSETRNKNEDSESSCFTDSNGGDFSIELRRKLNVTPDGNKSNANVNKTFTSTSSTSNKSNNLSSIVNIGSPYSSGDDEPIIFLNKQKKQNIVISEGEDNKGDKSNEFVNKSLASTSMSNSSKNISSFVDRSNEKSTDSSDDDFPIIFHRKQKKRNIVSSQEEDENTDYDTSNGKRMDSSDDEFAIASRREQEKHAIVISNGHDKSNAFTNKRSANISSTSDTSKTLGSFIDKNLFADESHQNSTASEIQASRNSKSSSSRSSTTSNTEYRAEKNSINSDENDNGDYNNSKLYQSPDYKDKKVRGYRSSIQQSTIAPSDSELLVINDSDDEKFEAEFQRNVYSPRTRMSITGKCNTSDLSDSEDEISVQPNVTNIDVIDSIEIPDSDMENDGNSIEIVDDNTSNRYLNIKSFNTSGLKNPLQASSPISKPKPMLQPKITKLAKVYVSQEFFDKQVIKLNDMENELHKSVQLRGAFQVKLPDDGRRLSGRINRLKLDIEQQQEYIASLEIQTSFDQNEIKLKPKLPPTKVIELSWEALDAANNEVQPKYTGAVGLKTFNTQKVMTLDTLKDIHESISSCPTPDTFANDPQGLIVELMPHQKHALAWLEWRETQKPRGGILADDMGLGKTLTLISHVLAANYRKENCLEEESDEMENPHSGWAAKGRKDHYAGGTLVVCPASLIGQWESEIKTRVKRNILTYVVHHGSKRDVKARHLAKADMVITTYNIVSRECSPNNIGPLANIKWERVVLDEAHVIRNHKSRMSESVSSLIRRCNWILTGTPIQNKEMDMFALFRFLKCRPFDDMAQFKKWIDNKNAGGQLRMNTILKAILLRRTKAELIAAGGLLSMPTKTVHIVEVTLEKDEMNVYQKIMLYSQTLFAQYLHQRAEKDDGRVEYHKKKAPNNAFHKAHKMMVQMHSAERDVKSHEILVLLLRLRQICCHPGLITAMLEEEDKSAVFEDSTSEHDSIDIDLMEQLNKLNINENDTESASFEIPHNDRMLKASHKVLLKSNPVYDLSKPSSKFLKVLEVLKKHVLPKYENAVIVSQWTNVLEIIGMMLRREGISSSSLTGSVPVKDRGAIVENFNKISQHSKVLLLSLTAGGVGLNLVGGNHLLLVDLHWNPQLEAQAQDRVYRVGQTMPVLIYKFVCTNTIEQRILKLQERKLEIANGVLTGSGTKGSKLSIDDLKSLFEV